MSNNKKSKCGHSMSIGTILGIVFIILKLAGLIKWSWVWVLAPFWIGATVAILLFIIAIITSLICYGVDKKTKQKK